MPFYKGGKEAIETCPRLHRMCMIQPGSECTKQVTGVSALITTIPYFEGLLFLPGTNGSIRDGETKRWIGGSMEDG